MMKYLNGAELAEYIKERQAKQVRGLRQAYDVYPRLAIVQTVDSPVIDTYVRLKRAYGEDILIDVDLHKIDQSQALDTISQLNDDQSIHGIIVQLPLADIAQTEELVNSVSPTKDVDGLSEGTMFDAATPMAIDWLLAGYNVNLSGRRLVVVGKGRLVGAPLASRWHASGFDVTVVDRSTQDIAAVLRDADVVVTAAGSPGLITSEMLKTGAVVVDAATSSESGRLLGDVDDSVRQRDDLVITPQRGGVGPLTVCALFDNVIRAARSTIESSDI